MTSDRTLSISTVTRIINALLEKVDIADWLFNLPDAEYQRCSRAHIGAGTTTSDDGRPMTINVETIGDALMVQHFVSEVRESKYCRLVSISDAITPKGRTKVQVVWELSAKKINDHTCEYSNHIHASATDEFLAFIEKNGVTFEQARTARQEASNSHNHEETPNFAKKHRTQIPIEGLISGSGHFIKGTEVAPFKKIKLTKLFLRMSLIRLYRFNERVLFERLVSVCISHHVR